MTVDLLYFLLTLSGTIVLILFGIIAYFLKIVHNDAKQSVIEVSKNRASIDLVQLQLNNDVKRIEQTTQLELRNLADNVNRLSICVEQLVKMQIDKTSH